MGIYDVLADAPSEEEQAKLHQFHQQSTVPIVKFEKKQREDSDDSSSSSSNPDDNLYMEFDSSDEEMVQANSEMISSTTANTQKVNKPLIQELSSVEFV